MVQVTLLLENADVVYLLWTLFEIIWLLEGLAMVVGDSMLVIHVVINDSLYELQMFYVYSLVVMYQNYAMDYKVKIFYNGAFPYKPLRSWAAQKWISCFVYIYEKLLHIYCETHF